MIRLPPHIRTPLIRPPGTDAGFPTTYTSSFAYELIITLLKTRHESAHKFKIEEVLVNEDEDITTLIFDGGEGIIFKIDIETYDFYGISHNTETLSDNDDVDNYIQCAVCIESHSGMCKGCRKRINTTSDVASTEDLKAAGWL
jgi:hypothetical protein